MADETQTTKAGESAVEGAAGGSASAKNNKINRMTLKELTAKIESAEKNKLTGSKYYAHLLLRKKELEVS